MTRNVLKFIVEVKAKLQSPPFASGWRMQTPDLAAIRRFVDALFIPMPQTVQGPGKIEVSMIPKHATQGTFVSPSPYSQSASTCPICTGQRAYCLQRQAPV